VRADVSSSVRSILPCTERLYCIPLHTCQHAGALPAATNTSPTPRRRTVRTKYYYFSKFMKTPTFHHVLYTFLCPQVLCFCIFISMLLSCAYNQQAIRIWNALHLLSSGYTWVDCLYAQWVSLTTGSLDDGCILSSGKILIEATLPWLDSGKIENMVQAVAHLPSQHLQMQSERKHIY
jgi:hypothetical protein